MMADEQALTTTVNNLGYPAMMVAAMTFLGKQFLGLVEARNKEYREDILYTRNKCDKLEERIFEIERKHDDLIQSMIQSGIGK